jgi:hypothetical protein
VAASVGREAFDCAVVDLRFSVFPAERLASMIEEIPPSLVRRTLVVSKDHPEEKALRLIEELSIPQIPQNRLVPTLWESIQKLLVAPGIGHPARKGQHTARLIFGSSLQRRPGGLRGGAGFGQHLAFQSDNVIVDVSIEPGEKPGRLSLVGQVVESQSGRGLGNNLPVILNGRAGLLARTFTKPSGEFAFDIEFMRDLELEIRTDKGTWVTISLPRVTWTDGTSPWRAAG